jgi:hypothetical protein
LGAFPAQGHLRWPRARNRALRGFRPGALRRDRRSTTGGPAPLQSLAHFAAGILPQAKPRKQLSPARRSCPASGDGFCAGTASAPGRALRRDSPFAGASLRHWGQPPCRARLHHRGSPLRRDGLHHRGHALRRARLHHRGQPPSPGQPLHRGSPPRRGLPPRWGQALWRGRALRRDQPPPGQAPSPGLASVTGDSLRAGACLHRRGQAHVRLRTCYTRKGLEGCGAATA